MNLASKISKAIIPFIINAVEATSQQQYSEIRQGDIVDCGRGGTLELLLNPQNT